MNICMVAVLACGCLALSNKVGDRGKALGAHQSAGSVSRTGPASKDTRGAKAGFKVVSMGEMKTEYGCRLGFTNLKAADDTSLWVFYLAKDDQVQADKMFSKELTRAVKVVERGEKRNVSGKVVGERAEILAPAANGAPPAHAVIWTDGPTFHEIGSSSLEHVLELEKLY